MLKITNLKVNLTDSDQEILHDANLEIKPGETHVLQGRNGSGKSTLAAVLSGNPTYQITAGKIELIDENYPTHIISKLISADEIYNNHLDLTEMDPDKRALAGIFLANQYPLEIPGVNLSNFLRLAYNTRQEADLPVFKFRQLLKDRAGIINYPEHLLDRNLNEGFSGGEKKKTEILQMALLEPKYAILDETDSGLDQEAIKDVFTGINKLREIIMPDLGVLIITHYEKVFSYIQPDFVHEMKDGVLK